MDELGNNEDLQNEKPEEGVSPDSPSGIPLPGDARPLYMQDEPPKGKTDYVKWGLMHGRTEEELIDEGCNPGTVRVCAQELDKEGLRERPKKAQKPGKDVATVESKPLQIFARGSPPEALVESMHIPAVDGELAGFEKGMKFGASVLVLGVRIAQELSSIGIQQARPLVEMARDMRSGEAAAAKSAAGEAAMLAAATIQQNLQPYLASMSRPADADPMKGMMARVMEPMLANVMNKFLPGMGGAKQLPQGWTKKTG